MILMDLIMPDMDGLQTTRTIRSIDQPQLRETVVIGLTASSHPQDHADCMAAGMNGLLRKPLQPQDLARLLEQAEKRDAA